MRIINYKSAYDKLLTPEIVLLLAQIHEQKGQQSQLLETQEDALTELLEIAKIQSTEASNRIEGIITTDDRLKKGLFGCHPCENTSSIRFATRDLREKILTALGYTPAIVHLVGADEGK